MVDDWDFSEAQFTEFVGTTFTLLAAFMGASSEYDSQLQVCTRLECTARV